MFPDPETIKFVASHMLNATFDAAHKWSKNFDNKGLEAPHKLMAFFSILCFSITFAYLVGKIFKTVFEFVLAIAYAAGFGAIFVLSLYLSFSSRGPSEFIAAFMERVHGVFMGESPF